MSAPYPEKTDYPAEAPPAYPAGGQPYPPQGGQPYPPQGGQPYPPQGGQPYPPQGGQPYPPQGGQPYPPQGGQPYPPQGHPPQGQGAPYGAPQPGVQYTAAPQTTVIVRESQVQPSDYLAFAICVTVCCCLPFGIVAIVKSMEVRNRHLSGDFAGAEESSRSAKNWSIAGLVSGIVLEVAAIIFIIVYYVVILASVASSFPSY